MQSNVSQIFILPRSETRVAKSWASLKTVGPSMTRGHGPRFAVFRCPIESDKEIGCTRSQGFYLQLSLPSTLFGYIGDPDSSAWRLSASGLTVIARTVLTAISWELLATIARRIHATFWLGICVAASEEECKSSTPGTREFGEGTMLRQYCELLPL